MKIVLIALFIIFMFPISVNAKSNSSWWPIRSVDTMKYSRDPSKQILNDPTFDNVIDQQIKNIASIGATHVAIATPYDSEFVPVLTRWVKTARKYKLNVWFRGNFSGWEEWFGYPSINREQHSQLLVDFINNNSSLFADGDIFSSCPECENGGPGDPRQTGDIAGHRAFLIREHYLAKQAFANIGKKVSPGFYSMNGDVARLIMDRDTTSALGGIVTIDHYVKTPQQLIDDVNYFINTTGGQVMLGEFGAPIPDIHGNFTAKQQADWISSALDKLSWMPGVVGLNYWTSVGGSTEIWDALGQPFPAVAILSQYYSPSTLTTRIINEVGAALPAAKVAYHGHTFPVSTSGLVSLPLSTTPQLMQVTTSGYFGYAQPVTSTSSTTIMLKANSENWWFKAQKLLYRLLGVTIPSLP